VSFSVLESFAVLYSPRSLASNTPGHDELIPNSRARRPVALETCDQLWVILALGAWSSQYVEKK
jgi:hypothetical protein